NGPCKAVLQFMHNCMPSLTATAGFVSTAATTNAEVYQRTGGGPKKKPRSSAVFLASLRGSAMPGLRGLSRARGLLRRRASADREDHLARRAVGIHNHVVTVQDLTLQDF